MEVDYEVDLDLEFYCKMDDDNNRDIELETSAAKTYTLQELLSQLESF